MTNRHHNANLRSTAQRGEAVTWVGANCGRHGSYVFYKAFRYHISTDAGRLPSATCARNRGRRHQSESSNTRDDADPPVDDVPRDVTGSEERILALGEFFFVQCRPEDPVCVGELQLLWHDKHSGQDLASTRLYYLPDTTPAGRNSQHGEDEMLAVSEKIVMRTSDLASWLVEPEEWNYGSQLLLTPIPKNGGIIQPNTPPLHRYSLLHSSVNMQDVITERRALQAQATANCICSAPSHIDDVTRSEGRPQNCQCHRLHTAEVVMLSVNAYCRHKALMKRIEGTEREWLQRPGAALMLAALGIFTSVNPRARVVFCRDTFDYPQLFEHDLICEELAPVFKGRPRKKPKKNGTNGNKISHKKSTPNTGIKTLATKQENGSSVNDKDGEALTPTRRCSTRRRSKRKSPQASLYEHEFAPQSSRSAKRSRRTSARTPTPVSDQAETKPTFEASSKSEPASPDSKTSHIAGYSSEATVGQTIDAVAQAAVTKSWKKRPKRRPGRRSSPSALSIAIKNSLLENNPVPKVATEDKQDQRPPSTSSCVSSSSEPSSRSSSPSSDLRPRDIDGVGATQRSDSPASVTSSIASHDENLSSPSSGSPLDFAAIMSDEQTPVRSTPITIEDSESLRGLRNGKILESRSAFLDLLYQFMRKRNTPIGRVPSLGFKRLDLWAFFKLSQEYGGYDMVTAKRLWKHVYDRMGGNPSCTSAATCTRKHFEKLLLPLEMYLRKTLRNKEPDTCSAKADGENDENMTNPGTPVHISPQRRAFNGDAYFHNEVSLHKTSKSSPQPFNRQEASPESLLNGEKAAPNTATAAIASSIGSFVNFEALAHNVIRDELLASRGQAKPQDSNTTVSPRPEDLSKNTETSYTITKPITNPLTTPTIENHHPTGPKSTPSLFSIRSRTHCPRSSRAPPPFIPTKSKTHPYQPEIAADAAETNRSQLATRTEELSDRDRIPEWNSNQQKRQFVELSMLGSHSPSSPKRPCTGVSLKTPPSSSRKYDIRNLVSIPSEENPPKPANPYTGPVKSHATQENAPITSETEATRIKYDPLIRSVFPGHRPTKVAPLFENERKDSHGVALHSRTSDQPPRQTDERTRYHRDNNTDPHRRSDAGFEVGREAESAIRSSSASSGYFHPPKNKEVYYRPVGMLASLREQKQRSQQQKHSDTPPRPAVQIQPSEQGNLSANQTDDRKHPRHHRTSSPNRSVVNGGMPYPPTPTNPVKRETPHAQTLYSASSRPPPKREAEVDRKPFSASFSVDRLTSKNKDGSHKPQPKQETTPQRHVFVPGGIPTPKPSPYGDRTAAERRHYIPTPSSDAFRSHPLAPAQVRNGATPTRHSKVEFVPDRSPRDSKSDLYSSPAGRGKVPSPPGKMGTNLSSSASALLATLPPPVAAAIYPFIPKDCPPHLLARILQETEKAIGILPPVVPPAVPPPLDIVARHQAHMNQQQKQLERHTALQDAVLRHQMAENPFRLITPQQQHAAAAAAHFARATSSVNGGASGNRVPVPDPAAMASTVQMYQVYTQQLASLHQNVARQLQETAGPSVTSTDMLQQLARASQFANGTSPLPDHLRNPAFLTATPPIHHPMTPEVAARLAYSMGRR